MPGLTCKQHQEPSNHKVKPCITAGSQHHASSTLSDQVTSRYIWDCAVKVGCNVLSRHVQGDVKRAEAAANLLAENSVIVIDANIGHCMGLRARGRLCNVYGGVVLHMP